MRNLSVMLRISTFFVLTTTSFALAKPTDKPAAELLQKIILATKDLKPRETVWEEFAKELIASSRELKLRMVATYGLSFASDKESMRVLKGLAKPKEHSTVPGMASWAILVRKMRSEPAEKRLEMLKDAYQKSGNSWEKIMIANTLGSQHLAEGSDFLLEALQKEIKALKSKYSGKLGGRSDSWILCELAYQLSRSSDREVLKSTLHTLKDAKKEFIGFGEAFSYFMGSISKNRPKDDMLNSLPIIIDKVRDKIEEGGQVQKTSTPEKRDEEEETTQWLLLVLIIAVVVLAGLVIFLLLRRKK